MSDVEAGKFARGGLGIDTLTTDVAAQLIVDFGQKSCQICGLSFGHQFDSAIGQVANEAGDRVAARDRPRGVAEADALHVAAEVDRSAHLGVGGTHGDDWPNEFCGEYNRPAPSLLALTLGERSSNLPPPCCAPIFDS